MTNFDSSDFILSQQNTIASEFNDCKYVNNNKSQNNADFNYIYSEFYNVKKSCSEMSFLEKLNRKSKNVQNIKWLYDNPVNLDKINNTVETSPLCSEDC